MSSRQCCESREVKVLVPPIACSRAASISDACEGNDARSAGRNASAALRGNLQR